MTEQMLINISMKNHLLVMISIIFSDRKLIFFDEYFRVKITVT